MKLRTDGKTIRLLLPRSEVARFADCGSGSVQIVLPGGCLEYSLEAADIPGTAASFEANRIRVAVPNSAARQWTASDEVGIYGVHNAIAIAIEKDFRPTSAASPDDHDRYPNARAS